jgi:hypothetical protein
MVHVKKIISCYHDKMRLQMVKMVISSINVEHAFISLSDGVELKKGTMIIQWRKKDDNVTQYLFEKYEKKSILQADENWSLSNNMMFYYLYLYYVQLHWEHLYPDWYWVHALVHLVQAGYHHVSLSVTQEIVIVHWNLVFWKENFMYVNIVYFLFYNKISSVMILDLTNRRIHR